MIWSSLVSAVQLLGVLVGLAFTGMVGLGLLSSALYSTERAEEPVENLRLVIPTVAAEHVRPALVETIEHTVSNFPEYEVYCVLDEGSDLEDELDVLDDVTTVVVPASFDCEAVAKGRAIQYFIETVVDDAPGHWYGFIDDDNRILDDTFCYEIPHYEARGYRAMNPVLVPRQGRSVLTFMTDHIRYVDDISIYRLFNGVLGRPYLGFHGELLCARGDLLREVGFDRDTIVEDFAFALELAKRDVKVWQSATRVSVLSPHDVQSFLDQRARWYLGIARYLPRAPVVSQVVVGLRIAIWTVAVTSSWVFVPLWVLGYGLALPGWFVVLLALGGLLYIGTIALGARRIGGLRGTALLALTPVYALLEQIVPLYALWTGEREFVVIEK
ncbi:glycosyltransferase family 2 protein [Haloarchaeobius litoreus]|uniref:Glycosyltransferase family 2 protein n=1 Tax=Haloarchaeobius litoreus TaxID=755306 RepID=A0ABD6DQS3_9EURY|nr:glycosyltransferase family 2 protein [Haloarchaeobius litoreus]